MNVIIGINIATRIILQLKDAIISMKKTDVNPN